MLINFPSLYIRFYEIKFYIVNMTGIHERWKHGVHFFGYYQRKIVLAFIWLNQIFLRNGKLFICWALVWIFLSGTLYLFFKQVWEGGGQIHPICPIHPIVYLIKWYGIIKSKTIKRVGALLHQAKLPFFHKGDGMICYNYLYLVFVIYSFEIGLNYFRNKKSFFEYYEGIILAEAWSNPIYIDIIDLITPTRNIISKHSKNDSILPTSI